ncbi:hypothetical protein AMTRI_Chr12g241380 [Amborella trichopoda]|uniref:Hydroxyproline-rich glycoprotein family protein n=1 Tax=Amborella trichopoda TaxID=13333 RepID=W1PJR8_AMBTC|nr:uncharacterized protein LOC18435564 [Amborella trichopoda]ERN07345.1 hypothetical protein AMTR_s00019p00230490 [Amborella trichopoda]|eukprot:XP_006845670.1 uncharacterized protein LOC18435564 [Amborella trichopoda]
MEARKNPPPMIGKAGRYTVFITPPKQPQNAEEYPKVPPVQPPPQQFDKKQPLQSSSSPFSFVWNTVSKIQTVHSSIDECLADWFGLNQSKYQWALNEYYESKGQDIDVVKPKELANKGQNVQQSHGQKFG